MNEKRNEWERETQQRENFKQKELSKIDFRNIWISLANLKKILHKRNWQSLDRALPPLWPHVTSIEPRFEQT